MRTVRKVDVWGGALTAVVAGAAVDEILRLGGHGCEGALLMGARLGAGAVVSLDLLECLRMLFLRLRPDRLAGEDLADRRLEIDVSLRRPDRP